MFRRCWEISGWRRGIFIEARTDTLYGVVEASDACGWPDGHPGLARSRDCVAQCSAPAQRDFFFLRPDLPACVLPACAEGSSDPFESSESDAPSSASAIS